MKFKSLTLVLLSFVPLVFSQTVSLAYDKSYDNAAQSLSTVTCSDGTNGLQTKGYTTFGSLPTFPNIGGVSAVEGWNSPNCGTCWGVTYGETTINVLAVDHASTGFIVSLEAMNTLTDGSATKLGRVQVTASQVDGSYCGL